jgi:hypothetical protein
MKLPKIKKSTDIPNFIWLAMVGIEPLREYRFHTKRLFRFDFAFIGDKVAVEIEGGIWINGGHNRGKIYAMNMEKYNLAAEVGWIVLRYQPKHVDYDQIKRAIMFKRSSEAFAATEGRF